MPVFETASAAETVSLGRRLASRLRPGDVVALYGDLGSGKTTLVKGIAAGLGVSEVVKSPSFVIVTEYRGRLPLFHVDLYRIHRPSELDTLGLEECFGGQGVCVVEWADRAEGCLPENAIGVELDFTPSGRRIAVRGLEGFDSEPGQ